MFNVVLAYGADQKSVNAYGKHKLVSARNTAVHSIVVQSKAGADFYVQVYDVTGANEAAAGAAADLVPAEFEALCPAGSFIPFSFPGGWRCWKGLYVRCVSVVNGSSANLIAADDAKITAGFMDGPIV